MLKTDERRSGSIDGKAHRVHHLQQGGADDVVTELLIAALTASAHGKRPSPMQLAGFCSYQSDCMSLRAHIVTCHARSAADMLAWCSRQTSEGAARSTARRTACTTCSREELMT